MAGGAVEEGFGEGALAKIVTMEDSDPLLHAACFFWFNTTLPAADPQQI